MSTAREDPVQGDPQLQRVKNWVETSGRALELRVHRHLRAAGYFVGISVPYMDPTEPNTLREGDVQAIKPILRGGSPELLGQLILAIECKHAAKSAPWIGLRAAPRNRQPSSLDTWSPSHRGLDSDLMGMMLWGLLPGTGVCHDLATGYEREEEEPNRRNSNSASRNPAGDACRQVLSWAMTLKAQRDLPYLVLPVVVTTHPLYLVTLDENNEVEAERIKWLGCWKPLPGTASDSTDVRGSIVHIVHEAGLDEFLTAAAKVQEQMAAYLESPIVGSSPS